MGINKSLKNNSRASSTKDEKFCGVCHKAGKSKEEYTSHYTKTTPGSNGIVICPTILNSNCTYCKKTGHFKLQCTVLSQKEKFFPPIPPPPCVVQKKTKTDEQKKNNTSVTNMFNVLNSDSDEDEPQTTRDEPKSKKQISSTTSAFSNVTKNKSSTSNSVIDISDNNQFPSLFVTEDRNRSSAISYIKTENVPNDQSVQYKNIVLGCNSTMRLDSARNINSVIPKTDQRETMPSSITSSFITITKKMNEYTKEDFPELPSYFARRRYIAHDWADDDYWSDEDDIVNMNIINNKCNKNIIKNIINYSLDTKC